MKMLQAMCNGQVFTLRQVSGRDVMDAIAARRRWGGQSIRTRLILRSIIEIDRRPVFFPLVEWLAMSDRKRRAVDYLYSSLNESSITRDLREAHTMVERSMS